MGKRLHSAVKYEVEYGTAADFAWESDKVNPIIDILAEMDCSYDGDDICFSETVNANRANLLANIDKIITPDPSWDYQEDLDDMLYRLEKFTDITREHLHKSLKYFIEQSDSRCEDVHFAWY
jgi:D-mannonate dehydratase